jgi:hypothetical protein
MRLSHRPIAPTLIDTELASPQPSDCRPTWPPYASPPVPPPPVPPPPVPPPSWSSPSWSVGVEAVGPEPVAPASGPRGLVAVLAVVAAVLMSTSLWLSVANEHHRGRLADAAFISAAAFSGRAAFGGGAVTNEVDPAGLVSAEALPVPAPTLTAPRRPVVVAPRAAPAAAAPERSDAPTASWSETPETTEKSASVAPAAKSADSRLEQARRTARLLHEQLGSSVR